MKLFIFDLDGTLLNTIDDLGNSCNEILKLHDFPQHKIDAYKLFVGNGVQKLVERALPSHARNEECILRLTAEFTEHYEAHKNDHTRPYDGIIDVILELKNKNHLVSVASNKYHEATVALVDHYFPKNFFDLVLGHRNGKVSKPNPEIIYDTCQLLNIPKEHCCFVGDSSVDMQTARNANIKAVGVTWGFRKKTELLERGADTLIDEPHQLLSI